jgi:hypothetical protein
MAHFGVFECLGSRTYAFDEVGLLVSQHEREILVLDFSGEDRLWLRINPIRAAPSANPSFGSLEPYVSFAV